MVYRIIWRITQLMRILKKITSLLNFKMLVGVMNYLKYTCNISVTIDKNKTTNVCNVQHCWLDNLTDALALLHSGGVVHQTLMNIHFSVKAASTEAFIDYFGSPFTHNGEVRMIMPPGHTKAGTLQS